MRYRLMATYQGVPYEAGIGPSEDDVVLFAACPPPEELGFEPATGHWRKQLRVADVQALWESRPTGIFRGGRCIILDDLDDRLHIAYLGHDAYHAEQLGYWQVDRGVFELVAPRDEVTDVIEERSDYPHRRADGPAAPQLSGPQLSGPELTGPPGQAALSGPGMASGPGSGPGPVTWPDPQAAQSFDSGAGLDPEPVPYPVPAYPTAPYRTAPHPILPPSALAPGHEAALGSPVLAPGRGTALGPSGPAPGHEAALASSAPAPGRQGGVGVAIPPQDEPPLPLEAAALRASAAARRKPQASSAVASPAERAPGGPAPASARRTARRRLATQRIFTELADQASIPASAYAIGQEVDGALCLLQASGGFEVFNAVAGSRHEVRLFADEESAYFYLFGVLAAEAVRTGSLVPGGLAPGG
jgi:hypothetical protein